MESTPEGDLCEHRRCDTEPVKNHFHAKFDPRINGSCQSIHFLFLIHRIKNFAKQTGNEWWAVTGSNR